MPALGGRRTGRPAYRRLPATEDTARRFLARVAVELGLDAKFVFPAYEDAFYYLWRERRLPGNVDPLDSIPSSTPRIRRAASPHWLRTQRFAGSFANAKPRPRTRPGMRARRPPLPPLKESAAGIVRTSMCAQPRNGVLYIFMPPVRELEHYVELVAAVEATAAVLGSARHSRRLPIPA
jgi:uncharacterized protein (DUF2126 family)